MLGTAQHVNYDHTTTLLHHTTLYYTIIHYRHYNNYTVYTHVIATILPLMKLYGMLLLPYYIYILYWVPVPYTLYIYDTVLHCYHTTTLILQPHLYYNHHSTSFLQPHYSHPYHNTAIPHCYYITIPLLPHYYRYCYLAGTGGLVSRKACTPAWHYAESITVCGFRANRVNSVRLIHSHHRTAWRSSLAAQPTHHHHHHHPTNYHHTTQPK